MDSTINPLLKALTQSRRNGESAVAVLGKASADGWAPLALAQLLKEGWLQWAVLSLYDSRWLQACALVGITPSVYDVAAGALPLNGAGPTLIFLGGQAWMPVALSPEQEQQLWRRLPAPGVIVDLQKTSSSLLTDMDAFTLFRIGAEEITRPEKRAIQAIPDMTCEQLLVTMARGLHAFPPALLRQPLAVLQESFARLPPLVLAHGTVELTPAVTINQLLEEASDVLQGGNGRLEPSERLRLWRQYAVQLALLAGDYDAASAGLADAEQADSEVGKRMLVWCLLEQAETLCFQASHSTVAEASQYYARAGELFRKTLELQPDNFDAYAQWGAALRAQGTADREAAQRYYRAAAEKFKAALNIRHDAEVLYGWGFVLQGQAETQLGDAADALYGEAAEKYALALEIRPDFHQALWQWGEALRNQALSKRGAEIDELYQQAEEKFAAAAALQPDDGAMINRWGLVLLEQANRAMGDQRKQLLDEASHRFYDAERLQPGVAAYDLACLASLRRDEEATRVWLLKAKEFGALPPAQHVINDPDLDWLRRAPWLMTLVSGV